MPGGDTTQFLIAPDVSTPRRGAMLALVAGFWTFCILCTALSVLFDIVIAGLMSPLAFFGSPLVILAALVPNLAIAFAIPRLQRYQTTHRYVLAGAFLAGAIVAIPPALLFNTLLFLPVEAAGTPTAELLGFGTIAGIVEEGIKGAILLVIFFRYRDEFHDPVDGIVIGALVGLGFAMTEDITYFLRGLSSGGVFGFALTVFFRVFLGWMNHSVFTAITGAALGLARVGPRGPRRWAWGIGGYIAAASLHNGFNFGATLLDQLSDRDPIIGLVGLLPLYGLTWTALTLLGIVVVRGWGRQAAIARAELRAEVDAGHVTAAEYAALPDPGRRRALLRDAAAGGGKVARARLAKLFQLQLGLALQKRHTALGDPPGLPQLHGEEALRARIADLRAVLAPPPPPPVPPPPAPAFSAPVPAVASDATGRGAAAIGPDGAAPVDELRLVVAGDEGSAATLRDGLTIGRSTSRAGFVLPDPEVSGLHARVERAGGLPVLVDAGSTNGTWVNGERVERRPLRPGDRVRLGNTEFLVQP